MAKKSNFVLKRDTNQITVLLNVQFYGGYMMQLFRCEGGFKCAILDGVGTDEHDPVVLQRCFVPVATLRDLLGHVLDVKETMQFNYINDVAYRSCFEGV